MPRQRRRRERRHRKALTPSDLAALRSGRRRSLLSDAASHGPYLWTDDDVENALAWFDDSDDGVGSHGGDGDGEGEGGGDAKRRRATSAMEGGRRSDGASGAVAKSRTDFNDEDRGGGGGRREEALSFLRSVLQSRGVMRRRPGVGGGGGGEGGDDDERRKSGSSRKRRRRRSSSLSSEMPPPPPLRSVLLGYARAAVASAGAATESADADASSGAEGGGRAQGLEKGGGTTMEGEDPSPPPPLREASKEKEAGAPAIATDDKGDGGDGDGRDDGDGDGDGARPEKSSKDGVVGSGEAAAATAVAASSSSSSSAAPPLSRLRADLLEISRARSMTERLYRRAVAAHRAAHPPLFPLVSSGLDDDNDGDYEEDGESERMRRRGQRRKRPRPQQRQPRRRPPPPRPLRVLDESDSYFSHPDTAIRSCYASRLYDRLLDMMSTAGKNGGADKDEHSMAKANTEAEAGTARAVETFLSKLRSLARSDGRIREVLVLMLLEPVRRLGRNEKEEKGDGDEKCKGLRKGRAPLRSMAQSIADAGEDGLDAAARTIPCRTLLGAVLRLAEETDSITTAAASDSEGDDSGTNHDGGSRDEAEANKSLWSLPPPLLRAASHVHRPFAVAYVRRLIDGAARSREEAPRRAAREVAEAAVGFFRRRIRGDGEGEGTGARARATEKETEEESERGCRTDGGARSTETAAAESKEEEEEGAAASMTTTTSTEEGGSRRLSSRSRVGFDDSVSRLLDVAASSARLSDLVSDLLLAADPPGCGGRGRGDDDDEGGDGGGGGGGLLDVEAEDDEADDVSARRRNRRSLAFDAVRRAVLGGLREGRTT